MKEFFQSMVTPRWKRGDAKNRRQAIKELGEDDAEILLEITLTDEDESVRIAACKKLEAIEHLESVVEQSTCAAVTDRAASMIRRMRKEAVLKSNEGDWQVALANVKHDECLAEIVADTDNHELRMAAVERIVSQDALMTVVTSGCGKEVGLRALERLDGLEVLKEIAANGGNKAVRHEAASRLEAMLAPEEPVEEEPEIDVAAELQGLVDYAESIKGTYNFDGVAKLLSEKEAAWKELDPQSENPLYPRFQELVELFQKRRDEFAEKQAEQKRCMAEQRELSDKKAAIVEAVAALKPQDEGVGETLAAKREEWAALDALADDDAEEAYQRSFARMADELQNGLATLSREAEQKTAIEAILVELETALESGDKSALHANKKKTWKQPDWQFNDPEPLKQRFNRAINGINETLDKAAKEREENKQKRHDELTAIIPKIKEQEDVENRRSAVDKVKHLQERWQELDGWNDEALTKDYKAALDAFWEKQREFREERDWQEWANKGIKEKLIKAVEATASIEDLNQVAKIIREAQKKWKATGPVPHKDNEPMWQLFHEACEANYARCKDYFDEKEQTRQANLEFCTKLCEEAESLKESDDWRSAVGRYKAMQKEWKQHGSLPRKEADDLYNRFRTACDAFFERFGEHMVDVDSHRDENQAAKEELIKQAKTLVDDDPVRADACIALQNQWKELGPGLKEKDEETWNAFRAACDAVFEKLEAEHIKNVPAKEALCETIEALVAEINDDTDRKTLADQIIAAQKEWKELGPLPKSYEGDISKRFRKACNSFFDRRREEYAAMADERERNLAIKRDLVEKAESLADSTDWKETADELKQLQSEWKTIGPVPREYDKEVWQAFRAACDTFFTKRKEYFGKMDHRRQENLFEKEELLSVLEKIVGTDEDEAAKEPKESKSKLDLADQLQMAFATNFAMGGSSGSDRDEVRRIQERWKEIGPVPREKNDALWKRYKNLLDKFYGNE